MQLDIFKQYHFYGFFLKLAVKKQTRPCDLRKYNVIIVLI
jgi:hypothetical protein